MNRWKTKKKANKEAEAAAVRGPSTDSDPPPPVPVLKSSKTFRLGRKAPEPEVKKEEFSLENALPSSDDFRTSLLMSGLSARFSMLREQDDPKSKIGKASDDSVLFPKRQSRLNDFGFQAHGLSDIAEVSSIHGSIRPPFAFGRTDSYHEGYGTDDDQGSIMSRKKPTEGNNLFGGRQKIYKIAGNSSSTTATGADSSSGGMGGRALYDDDVSQSAFQKLREKEREQQRRAEPEEEMPSRSTSPIMTGYNRNRETSSTTTSTTRSSTAATSVTSQRTPSLSGPHNSANPNVTKGRRLYENGLDQQLHEQQHSAMSRIDTLTRQRTLGGQTPPPGLSSPVGGTMGNERWERHPMAGKQSMPNLRAASPTTITPLSTFDFGVKPINTSDTKSFGASSPLSPPISEHGDTPALPFSANDRGKVTAFGAFNKPAVAYDENKYSQRQLQMASGRETPPPRKQSPPRTFPVRPPPQQAPQMPRNRAESNVAFPPNRSRSSSSAQRQFLPQERITESSTNHQAAVLEESPASSGTFLETSEQSSVGTTKDIKTPQARLPTPAEIYKMHRAVPKPTSERPPESQHPALRQQPFAQPPPIQIQAPYLRDAFGNSDSRTPTIPILTPALSPSNLTTPIVESPADSPTLGPTSGLNSIRQHLRTDSNSSSVYSTMQSAGLVSRFPEHNEHDCMPENDFTIKDNAWDTGDWDRGYEADYGAKYNATSPPRKNEDSPPPLSVRTNDVESTSQEDARPSWEQEMNESHVPTSRTSSSATQKEQQDFQNELAFRRRQIKENMKSFVETESRSASPGPGTDSPRDYSAIKNPALSLLKSKTSRGSLAGKQNQNGQSKAMKMLGIGGPSNSATSSPVKQGWEDNSMWKQEEEEMLRGIPTKPVSPPQTKAFRQARRDAQRDRERLLAQRTQQNPRPSGEGAESQWNGEIKPVQRMASNDRFPPNIRTDPRDPSRDRKPPPVAYTQRNESSTEGGSRAASRSSRDRSSSDASVRSKSRNGRYKDDLAKAMAEGTSTSNQGYDDLEVPTTRFLPRSPGTPNMYQNSPIPSPLPGTPARSRSNSNLPQAGYFPPTQKFPGMQINTEIDQTPRPAPAFVVNPTPSLMQPSPVPSAANTPTSQAFQSKLPAPRKRSINKHEISEPKLISSTSRITTVNLPPGSSLSNGSEPQSAPPIPPVNPRRRQTRAMFGFGRKEELEELHALPAATQSTEEMSTFSADENDKPRSRQKLRKSSSEGGNLNARARQAAFAAPSPALPTGTFPPGSGSPPRRPVEGGMF